MRRSQRHEARSRGPISEPRARHIVAIGREAAVVLPVQGGINGKAARSTATGRMKELPGGLASKGFGVVDVFHKVEHRNGCSGQISQAVGQRMFGRPAHVTEGILEARTAAQPHRPISAILFTAKKRRRATARAPRRQLDRPHHQQRQRENDLRRGLRHLARGHYLCIRIHVAEDGKDRLGRNSPGGRFTGESTSDVSSLSGASEAGVALRPIFAPGDLRIFFL